MVDRLDHLEAALEADLLHYHSEAVFLQETGLDNFFGINL